MTGQIFKREEDVPFRIHVTPTDRTQPINQAVVMLDVYDATTTPEQLLFTKDNGSTSDPSFKGGGNLVYSSPDRLTLDFVLYHDSDLSLLPPGQRNLKYVVYAICNGIKSQVADGSFTVRA
jgi:hypothetical protein